MNLSQILNEIIKYMSSLPKKDLAVGVIVPILSACISYNLVQRSTRKKESNRLYIEIELILRELISNLKSINEFIELDSEYKKLEEKIKVRIPFSKDILYNVLLKLNDIKDNYFYHCGHIFEKPNCLYIYAQKKETIDEEIEEVESNINRNSILEQKRQAKIAQLQEARQELIEDIKKNQERDIYKEFKNIQKYFETNLIEGLIEKIDNGIPINKALIYIYETVKNFNNLTSKTKEDVIKIYKDLFVFEIDIEENNFDNEEFDFLYEEDYGNNPIYNFYKDFINIRRFEEKIKAFSFDCYNSKWKEFYSDLVMINDSSLFVCIYDFYENYIEFAQNCFNDGKDRNNITVVGDRCKGFIKELNMIKENLRKKQLEIKKWCK